MGKYEKQCSRWDMCLIVLTVLQAMSGINMKCHVNKQMGAVPLHFVCVYQLFAGE